MLVEWEIFITLDVYTVIWYLGDWLADLTGKKKKHSEQFVPMAKYFSGYTKGKGIVFESLSKDYALRKVGLVFPQ